MVFDTVRKVRVAPLLPLAWPFPQRVLWRSSAPETSAFSCTHRMSKGPEGGAVRPFIEDGS